jgi:hypothetical protein
VAGAIEFSALSQQGLNRRIAKQERLAQEIKAVIKQRNDKAIKINRRNSKIHTSDRAIIFPSHLLGLFVPIDSYAIPTALRLVFPEQAQISGFGPAQESCLARLASISSLVALYSVPRLTVAKTRLMSLAFTAFNTDILAFPSCVFR